MRRGNAVSTARASASASASASAPDLTDRIKDRAARVLHPNKVSKVARQGRQGRVGYLLQDNRYP